MSKIGVGKKARIQLNSHDLAGIPVVVEFVGRVESVVTHMVYLLVEEVWIAGQQMEANPERPRQIGFNTRAAVFTMIEVVD